MSKNARRAIPANARGCKRASSGFDREPTLGAHLVSTRVGYSHHGIYVGAGSVVHYAGFCRRWQAGPIEEVTLSGFALVHPIRIIDHSERSYPPQEVVDRARSRIGEHDYHLMTNNCEHFCNWCVSGCSRSVQTERPLVLAFWALAVAVNFASRLPVALARLRVDLSADCGLRLKT